MDNKIKTLKVLGYDSFKCTADKCKFTCCEGWDICIDKATYSKWDNISHKSNDLLSKVKSKNDNSEKTYYINKMTSETCPLLEDNGLCNIVKSYGEEYLSVTCHSFPRLEKNFENIKELSLSCACPEVVEIISKLGNKVCFTAGHENKIKCDLLEVKIRESIIEIIENKGIKLEERLLISFEMLLEFLETEEELDEEYIVTILKKYQDEDFLEQRYINIRERKVNKLKAVVELNNLFLDITEFYKEVVSFKQLLVEVLRRAENIKKKEFVEQWSNYKEDIKEFDSLMEKCMVSKILGTCCSEDIEEMVIAMQMIIIEYILIKYAVFLKYLDSGSKKIHDFEVKEFIVAFSRIIGNNSDAVLDFLEDGFGDYILDREYVSYILMF